MTFRPEPRTLGITIEISPFRKSSGMKGCGRAGATGKKAVVTKEGESPVTLEGSTFKDLSRNLRSQFRIPPNVKINDKGVTKI